MLCYTLAGCGTSTGSSERAEQYANLPYADAATFAAPRAELAAALVKVLTAHGYAVADTTGGTVRGELTKDRKLQPAEYFVRSDQRASVSFLGIVVGIMLLIPFIASLLSHSSDESSITQAPSETPEVSYHYVVTATLATVDEERTDLTLAFDEQEYADNELVATTPIENAFSYALFDALQAELNTSAK